MRVLPAPFLNPGKQRFPYITATPQHVTFRTKRVQLADQCVKHRGVPYILGLDTLGKGNLLTVLVVAVLLKEKLRVLVFLHFTHNHFSYQFLFRIAVLGNKTFLVFIGKGGIDDLCTGTFSAATMGTFNGTTLQLFVKGTPGYHRIISTSQFLIGYTQCFLVVFHLPVRLSLLQIIQRDMPLHQSR